MEYVPDAGDFIWINFNPFAGDEINKIRPALVLSSVEYNSTGLLLCCPVTSVVKGIPFEVAIPEFVSVRGVVRADQIKSFDWRQRRAALITRAPEEVLMEVRARIAPLLGL